MESAPDRSLYSWGIGSETIHLQMQIVQERELELQICELQLSEFQLVLSSNLHICCGLPTMERITVNNMYI